MSGKLNHYFKEMDRLLALDGRYKRPGYTMDMNDCVYLYTLAVYSILSLKELGVKVDPHLELPRLMSEKVLLDCIYGREFCEVNDVEEDYDNLNYYTMQYAGMYEPYKGRLSRKNAYYELSDFMYRYFLDLRENNGFGLWTLFSAEDCMELCTTEILPGVGIEDNDTLIRAAAFLMCSHGRMEDLPLMGIELPEETADEVAFTVDNALSICGIFVLADAGVEKTAAELEKRNIHNGYAVNFIKKCEGLGSLLWRPGTSILADYVNNHRSVARAQIIGYDADFEVSFDYIDISPLLPVYLYYLGKAAEAVDGICLGGQVLKEGKDGKQK